MAIAKFPFSFSLEEYEINVTELKSNAWHFEVSDTGGVLYEFDWEPGAAAYRDTNIIKSPEDIESVHKIKQVFWKIYND